MDTQQPVVLQLADGNRLVLHAGLLTIRNQSGTLVTSVELDDVTGINRGGRDIVVTRRAADPIEATATTVTDAQRFITALHAQQRTAPQPKKRWGWRRR